MLATVLLCAVLASSPSDLSTEGTEGAGRQPSYLLQGGIAAAAGAIGVPVSFYVARLFGTLSNQLIWALVPALLVMGLLPAALVSLTSWLTRDWHRSEDEPRSKFVVPFLLTVVVNVAVMVIGGFLGVSLLHASGVVALTLIDSVAMAAVNVGTMRALTPAQAPATTSVASAQAMAPWAALSSYSF